MLSETVFEFSTNAGPVIPSEWNGVEIPFPREKSVLDFFRAQVQTRPQGIAIKEGNRLMTYAELDLCSNRVANELRRQGLPLDHPVAVLLPMSCDFITAILAVLKAGGCYLPASVDTPAVRLRFLLEDSGAGFVVTDANGRERLREWPGQILELARILREPLDRIQSGTPHPCPLPFRRGEGETDSVAGVVYVADSSV